MKNSIINRQFRYTFRNATAVILAVNILVYIVLQVFPDIVYYLSLVPVYVRIYHWYWQFLTYAFTHAEFWHLLSNMLALFIFGTAVERAVGTKEFLLFYLVVSVFSGAAAYLTYALSGNYYVVLLGASGAVYALMFLFSVLFPSAELLVFGVIPVRAPVLVVVYFLIEFFSQFSSDGTAHLVHLYGLLAALLYMLIRMRMNPLKRWGIIR